MSEENPYTAPQAEAQLSPNTTPGGLNLATLGERFLGALIDGIIMMVISVPLTIALTMFFLKDGLTTDVSLTEKLMGNSGLGLGVTLLLQVVFVAVYVGIQWTFWKGTSQSIGKKVMKTQIVNLDGTPADIQTIAVKRYLIMVILSMIPVVGGIINLVNILLVFRAERNCLHDDIAKTRVVKLPVPTA